MRHFDTPRHRVWHQHCVAVLFRCSLCDCRGWHWWVEGILYEAQVLVLHVHICSMTVAIERHLSAPFAFTT